MRDGGEEQEEHQPDHDGTRRSRACKAAPASREEGIDHHQGAEHE